LVEAGCGHECVLVEAGKGSAVAASETQCPIGEHPLDVGQMTDHLLDAPLPGGVAKRPLRLAQASEEGEHVLELAFECRDGLRLGDERDVLAIVGGVFVGGGTGGCGSGHGWLRIGSLRAIEQPELSSPAPCIIPEARVSMRRWTGTIG